MNFVLAIDVYDNSLQSTILPKKATDTFLNDGISWKQRRDEKDYEISMKS